MMGLQETLSLDTHENILASFRCNAFRTWLWMTPCVLFLFGLFLFMFPFFYQGGPGVFLFITLLLIDVIFMLRLLVMWYGTFYILTERRLFTVRRFGFFKKQVNEILLENINELSYDTKGMLQTLLGYGSIHCTLFPTNTQFTIEEISQPQHVLTSISRRVSVIRKMMYSQNPQMVTSTMQAKKILVHKKDTDPVNWK